MDRSFQNDPMGRPTEFDCGKARDKALVLFWRKGYQATSLADLVEAMGISRSSFYAAFGDKRSLFFECLDVFAGRTQALMSEARAAHPPLEALQFFFERSFIGSKGTKAHWGCMLVNTILEMAAVDDELSARASAHIADMQATFESCLLDTACSPAQARDFARMLMLMNEGVRVASRRKLAAKDQLDPIATTFRLLRSAIA
jgi:TetR/AcrR family transcriptional repressor of nem operon